MIIETATIYALCALALMLFITFVYFAIYFLIFEVILIGISAIIKPILKIINHD